MRALVAAFALALLLPGCLEAIGLQDARPVPPPAAYLRSDPYPDLLVEVDYAEGREPSDLALSTLESTLKEVTAKREVRILDPTRIETTTDSWNVESLLALEAETRSMDGGGAAAVMHVIYVNGRYTGQGGDGDGQVLGVEVAGHVFIFKDAFSEMRLPAVPALPGLPAPTAPAAETVERAVLVHEVGHALGLVNAGVPMVTPHEDAEHEGHSSNSKSVMYWALDSSRAVGELLRDNEFVPYRFDANDLADLKAYREG